MRLKNALLLVNTRLPAHVRLIASDLVVCVRLNEVVVAAVAYQQGFFVLINVKVQVLSLWVVLEE